MFFCPVGMLMRKIRIFVDQPLQEGKEFVLADEAAHHPGTGDISRSENGL